MRFDHVGLNVADLQAMTAWYSAALGLEVEFEFALDQVDFTGVMLRSPEGLPASSCCTVRRTRRPPGRATRSRPRSPGASATWP